MKSKVAIKTIGSAVLVFSVMGITGLISDNPMLMCMSLFNGCFVVLPTVMAINDKPKIEKKEFIIDNNELGLTKMYQNKQKP